MQPRHGSVDTRNAQRVIAYGRARGIELAAPPAAPRIPAARMYRIWAELATASGRPELAIQLAEGSRLEDLQLLGFAVMTAPTLVDALQTFVRFSPLLNDSGEFALSIERQALRVRWTAGERLELGVALSRETAFAQMAGAVRQLCGEVDPLRVSFRHAAPRHARAHRAFFGCEVAFEAPFDELLLPRALADATPSAANAPLWRYLCAQAEQLLRELAPRSLEARVRACIAAALATQRMPSLDAVASTLGTSARTLRRTLGQRGLSFRALVDDARKEHTRRWLLRDVSLSVVAFECGFADASALSHACTRWFGKPPSALRS